MLIIVGFKERRTATVPCTSAGVTIATSNVVPPVARITGEITPFTSILMLETTKLIEYIIEPFGRFADANVCEMFWSFSRLIVAEPPVGVIVIVCEFTRLP